MVVICEDLPVQTRGGGDAGILKYHLGYSLVRCVTVTLSLSLLASCGIRGARYLPSPFRV